MTPPLKGPWRVHAEYEGWEVNPDGHVRKRQNVTPDGRFVGNEVWKTIREFPNYQCTIDGDVRNSETYTVIIESVNNTGQSYYTLWKDGKSTSRNWKQLVYATFPELHEGWKDIPGYKNYQISIDGDVRGKRTWNYLPVTNGSFRVKQYGKRVTLHLDELYYELFGKVLKK